MFTRSGMLAVLILLTAAAAPERVAAVAAPGDPSREQLQHLLITSQDLEAVTKMSWVALPLEVRYPAGPAGTAASSGCPGMDNAVLANNTGLLDSGVQPFHTKAGDFLEETIAYDKSAKEHVQQLGLAIQACPVMIFTDGPPIEVKPIDLGETVAGFRAYIGGISRSVVLAAAYGDYVIELIFSDRDYPDSFYKALLRAAYYRVDNPS